MLAIIFFSVLFGLGVAAIGKRGEPILAFFQGTADAMFWVTNLIMKFAPFGVFALIGVTVSKFGLESLIPLGKLLDSGVRSHGVLCNSCFRSYCENVWDERFPSYQSLER